MEAAIGLNADIPHEIYLRVFECLPRKDLYTVGLVCRLWNSLAKDDQLWRSFALSELPMFRKPQDISWKQHYQRNKRAMRRRQLQVMKGTAYCSWGDSVYTIKQAHPGIATRFTCTSAKTGHDGAVQCCQALQNGSLKRLMTGAVDGTIKVWDQVFGTDRFALSATLTGHKAPVSAMAVTSRWLFSGDASGCINVWQRTALPGCYSLEQTHESCGGEITALCADHPYLATTFFSGTTAGMVHVWKKAGGKFACRQTIAAHQGAVSAIAYSPQQHALFTGALDKTVKIWNKTFPDFTLAQTLEHHDEEVLEILLTSDDDRFLSASAKGNLTTWKRTSRDASWQWHEKYHIAPGRGLQALCPLNPRPWLPLQTLYLLSTDAFGVLASLEEEERMRLAKITLDPLPEEVHGAATWESCESGIIFAKNPNK